MYGLLHGARVDETPSARGSIADQSMISGRFSTELGKMNKEFPFRIIFFGCEEHYL
jgi:hypothetical protein